MPSSPSSRTPGGAGSPTRSLLRALGLPEALEGDVALASAAYQPHAPQSMAADAAADRLVATCGGRTEAAAARVCVLLQAHTATLALVETTRSGLGEAPVPFTRRVSPNGAEVLVDLVGAPFGRGPPPMPRPRTGPAARRGGAGVNFAALHRPGNPFVLPNAWNVGSARLLAAAGFPAVGTTSLGVAAAHGLLDATGDARGVVVDLAYTLSEARLRCPVTCDLEDATDGALVDPQVQIRKIRAVKDRCPEVFVNARTGAVPAPLNVLASSTLTRRQLAEAGVARISTGSLLYRAALTQALAAAVAVRDGGPLPNAMPYADIQALSEAGDRAATPRSS